MKQNKIFISYAREDSAHAKRLYNELVSAGLDPWMDTESILPGENWKISIKQGISECRFFLALLSKNSVSKQGYVQKELKEALDVLDTFPPNEIYLIPIRLDDCTPTYDRLHDLNWLDLFPNWAHGMQRLMNVLNPTKVEPDDLDRYIRENIDTAKFEHPDSWADNSLLIALKNLGDDYQYFIWDQYLKVVRKFYQSPSGRWSVPYKLSEAEKQEVMAMLTSGNF